MKRGYLVLQNGQVFPGIRFGAEGETRARLVFETGMAGYLAVLADQRHAGHIVMMTFPMIGNYGAIPEDLPAEPALSAIIVRETCDAPSNFRSEQTFPDCCKARGVIGLSGIDTRALTHILREGGEMGAAIVSELPADVAAFAKALGTLPAPDYAGDDAPPRAVGGGGKQLALLDFGCGAQLADRLADAGYRVAVLPGNSPCEQVLATAPAGIALSDGPGDPRGDDRVDNVKALLALHLPVLALGHAHLLVARALGIPVTSMHCGHRGANQPVRRLSDGRLFITGQNHGFVAARGDLPAGVALAYENVNDGTCEGLTADEGRVTTLQFDLATLSAGEQAALLGQFVPMMEG